MGIRAQCDAEMQFQMPSSSFELRHSSSLYAILVELRLEEVDLHGGEQVALPERVRHRVLLAGMDLGYHENVVEEEYLALMNAFREEQETSFFMEYA